MSHPALAGDGWTLLFSAAAFGVVELGSYGVCGKLLAPFSFSLLVLTGFNFGMSPVLKVGIGKDEDRDGLVKAPDSLKSWSALV